MSDPYAARAYELVADKLTAHEHAIIDEVCRVYEAEGKIDPEMAVQKWIALAETRRVERKLRTGAKRSQADAVRHAQALDGA